MPHLLGLLLASAITAAATAFYVPRIAELEVQKLNDGAAVQFAIFAEAAQRFVESERPILSIEATQLPLSFPRSFLPQNLIARGVLNPRFVDENTFGQTHALIVRPIQLGPNVHFEALAITVGGVTIEEAEAARLAFVSSPRAGRVPLAHPEVAAGAAGQWRVDVADFSGGTVPGQHTPTPGHLVAYLSTLSAPAPLPGQGPGFEPRGVFSDGQRVEMPNCDLGQPEIYVIPVQYSDNGQGLPLLGVQAFAEASADSLAWIIRLEVFRESQTSPGSDEIIRPTGQFGRAAVFTACQ